MNKPRKTSEDSGAEPSEAGFYPALDRFSAFSDGVFAIAITLLVLELPVPPVDVPLVPALLEAWPDFLGYIMSFAFIGGIWLTHSGLTTAHEARGHRCQRRESAAIAARRPPAFHDKRHGHALVDP